MARILVIEDMKTVRRTVCAMLTRAGHDVTEAVDGRDGLDILQTGQNFDVVITDVLMPATDGAEVLLHLAGQPKRPRTLVISGGSTAVSREDAFLLARAKADAMMAKPFDAAELLATIDHLLQTAQPAA